MKTAAAALIALLGANRQFLWAELYSITLLNGTVLNYTSSDRDINLSGTVYKSTGALFTRDVIKTALGLQIDNLSLSITADASVMAFSTMPLLQAAVNGYLDGSAITVQRLFMGPAGWGDFSITPLLLWQGLISDVRATRSKLTISCVSAIEQLSIQLPRNLVQPACGNTLFDPLCTLNKASFAEALAAQAGGNNLVIHSLSAKATGYYNLGQITWTSGQNNGLTFSVRDYTGQIFTLNVAPPFPIANGDGFTAYPGCDKLQATCSTKFSNLINFRGMPYVPTPETAT